MIDDEVKINQFCTLLQSLSKKELIDRIAEIGVDDALLGSSVKKIHCEITHINRESDGWIRNIYVRREDSNKDDPFEKLIQCIRMTDDIWYSEDGLVYLNPTEEVDITHHVENNPIFKLLIRNNTTV